MIDWPDLDIQFASIQLVQQIEYKLASLHSILYSMVMDKFSNTDDNTLNLVAEDFTLAIGRLIRKLRAETNEAGLALSQMSAMSRLEQNGPMTTADLARAEVMKPQSMGVILSSLEQEELIERRRHPTDRRQILFVLTGTGRALRTKHRAMKRDWLVGALARLDPFELKVLTEAIPIIRQIGGS